MEESLGAKLANKFQTCKRKSRTELTDNVTAGDTSSVRKKLKKSQYFLDNNNGDIALDFKGETKDEYMSVNKFDRITTRLRKSKIIHKQTDDEKETEHKPVKKLSKTLNGHKKMKANLDTIDVDKDLRCNKKRQNKKKVNDGKEEVVTKKKCTDLVNTKEGNVEKTKLKKENSKTPKNSKMKKLIKQSTNADLTEDAGEGDKKDNINEEESEDDDDDDDDDWEEVKGGDDDDHNARLPRRPIQAVEVVVQKVARGKKTPEEQMMDEIRCAVNRERILIQKQCHQVHLLCYLAIGLHYNNICNDPDLQSLALSLVPIRFLDQCVLTWKAEDLHLFVTWFHEYYPCSRLSEKDPRCQDDSTELAHKLQQRLEVRQAKSTFEHTMMVVITLRVLGFKARLVHSFEPMTGKPSDLLKKPSSSSSSSLPMLFESSKMRKSSSKTALKKTKANRADANGISISKNKTTRSSRKDTTDIGDDDGDDNDRKESSIDGGDDDDGKFYWWSEVYLPEEKRWIYVNSHKCVTDNFDDARHNIKKPYSYVLAWQNDGHVKDLTSRYDSDWLLISCRKRLDPDWWKDTLVFYMGNQSEIDTEDMIIEVELFKQPLPTNVSAYKNHPLYVLGRHLLKFECIYPPTSLILGYVKDEPIYSRDCVHLLHSKEKWMVEGRVIRDGETSCKVVKRRPKASKKNIFMDNESLDLFGKWQTGLYVPRPAVDGIVPKNDFGNVEIFKPWMLPHGTVLMGEEMVGLNRVARKLDIDVAPAMLGWEFHRNISAPILKGWVVCIEHEEILIAAWEEEQRNIRKKELEKRQERILKNWKKLVRALLIREKLKERFSAESSAVKRNQNQTKKSKVTKKSVNRKKISNRHFIDDDDDNKVYRKKDNDKNNKINDKSIITDNVCGGVATDGGGFFLSDEETDDNDVHDNDDEDVGHF